MWVHSYLQDDKVEKVVSLHNTVEDVVHGDKKTSDLKNLIQMIKTLEAELVG